MAHRGLREWSGEEAGALALGQLGFTEITATGNAGTSGDNSGNDYFIAIKAVLASAAGSSTSEITCTAECVVGDDLSGTTLLPGDIVWGAYNYINVTSNTNSHMKLLCYYGKQST